MCLNNYGDFSWKYHQIMSIKKLHTNIFNCWILFNIKIKLLYFCVNYNNIFKQEN